MRASAAGSKQARNERGGEDCAVSSLASASACKPNLAAPEGAAHRPRRPRGRELAKLRARVFAAYGRRCADCGRSDVSLEVHHVNGDPMDNRIANTIPLCRDCHRMATFPGI
jgi:HNH endonuclease